MINDQNEPELVRATGDFKYGTRKVKRWAWKFLLHENVEKLLQNWWRHVKFLYVHQQLIWTFGKHFRGSDETQMGQCFRSKGLSKNKELRYWNNRTNIDSSQQRPKQSLHRIKKIHQQFNCHVEKFNTLSVKTTKSRFPTTFHL